jgi:hypothetical protein
LIQLPIGLPADAALLLLLRLLWAWWLERCQLDEGPGLSRNRELILLKLIRDGPRDKKDRRLEDLDEL